MSLIFLSENSIKRLGNSNLTRHISIKIHSLMHFLRLSDQFLRANSPPNPPPRSIKHFTATKDINSLVPIALAIISERYIFP